MNSAANINSERKRALTKIAEEGLQQSNYKKRAPKGFNFATTADTLEDPQVRKETANVHINGIISINNVQSPVAIDEPNLIDSEPSFVEDIVEETPLANPGESSNVAKFSGKGTQNKRLEKSCKNKKSEQKRREMLSEPVEGEMDLDDWSDYNDSDSELENESENESENEGEDAAETEVDFEANGETIDFTEYPLILLKGQPLVKKPQVVTRKIKSTPNEKLVFGDFNKMLNHPCNDDASSYLRTGTEKQRLYVIARYLSFLAQTRKQKVLLEGSLVSEFMSGIKRGTGSYKGHPLSTDNMNQFRGAMSLLNRFMVLYKYRADTDDPEVNSLSSDERAKRHSEDMKEYPGSAELGSYIKEASIALKKVTQETKNEDDFKRNDLKITAEHNRFIVQRLHEQTTKLKGYESLDEQEMNQKLRKELEQQRIIALDGMVDYFMGFYLLVRGMNNREMSFGDLKFTNGKSNQPITLTFTLEHEQPTKEISTCPEIPVFRHKNAELCLIGMIAMGLWYQFDYPDGFFWAKDLNFTDKSYFKKRLLYSRYEDRSKPISASFHRKIAKSALKAGNLNSKQPTRYGRQAGELFLNRSDLSSDDIRRLGCWKLGMMEEKYVGTIPLQSAYVMAGFNHEMKEPYSCVRETCKPSDNLRKKIFPFLEEEQKKVKDYYVANSHIDHTKSSDCFFDMLDAFRDIILQYLTVLVDVCPESVFCKHRITKDNEFKQLKAQIDQLNAPQALKDSLKRSHEAMDYTVPQLSNTMSDGFNRLIFDNQNKEIILNKDGKKSENIKESNKEIVKDIKELKRDIEGIKRTAVKASDIEELMRVTAKASEELKRTTAKTLQDFMAEFMKKTAKTSDFDKLHGTMNHPNDKWDPRMNPWSPNAYHGEVRAGNWNSNYGNQNIPFANPMAFPDHTYKGRAPNNMVNQTQIIMGPNTYSPVAPSISGPSSSRQSRFVIENPALDYEVQQVGTGEGVRQYSRINAELISPSSTGSAQRILLKKSKKHTVDVNSALFRNNCKLDSSIRTVPEVIAQWYFGTRSSLSVVERDRRFKSLWRKSSSTMNLYNKRKRIVVLFQKIQSGNSIIRGLDVMQLADLLEKYRTSRKVPITVAQICDSCHRQHESIANRLVEIFSKSIK